MKRPRIIAEQRDLPNYEKQRMLHLEENARKMEEKGYGTLATKILQQKAKLLSKSVHSEDDNSDKEEEYIPANEGDGSEVEMSDRLRRKSGDKEANMKKVCQEKGSRSGSMAEYLKQKALRKEVQGSIHSHEKKKAQLLSKSVRSEEDKEEEYIPDNEGDGSNGEMSDVLRNSSDKGANMKKQCQEQGLCFRSMAEYVKEKALKKEAQKLSDNKQPCSKRQKNSQTKRYCSPGALSKYHEMRKKQVLNSRGDVVIEGHSENENENEWDRESELQSLSLERRVDVEQETGDNNTYIVARERDSSPLVESSKEATKTKKGRGLTRLTNVHTQTRDQRLAVVLNSYGQPIGPTEKIIGEYTRFLGTLARDPVLAPITVRNWFGIDRDGLWKYVKDKYLVSEEGRQWAMDAIKIAWRGHKCRTKRKVYTAQAASQPVELPKTVPNDQLNELIDYWNDSDIEEESKRNKRNRECLDDMHTMGPKPLALLRHKLQKEDPNKEEPSLAKVYRESRKRDPQKTYKTSFSTTKANMEQMKALESQQLEGGGAAHKDPYYEVIKKPEHSGRPRLFGKVSHDLN